MSTLSIATAIDGQKGVAASAVNNESLAEMHFTLAGDRLLIIDHTHVDERLRGKGVGRQLLNEVIHWAQEHKRKIIPLCPYAKSVFDKEPKLRDVLGP